ncbi:MAG: hypothetical protein ACRDVP_06810 [Acidimicrobiales bacterium]
MIKSGRSGGRPAARGIGIDHQTTRRHIADAMKLGLERAGGGAATVGQMLERAPSHRMDSHLET